MPSIEQEPIYDVYCIGRRQYQRFLNNLFWDILMAQLVASMSGVVLGRVIMVVGSNIVRGKIFTVSIGSADSLYISVFIYRMNLHQFLILCSSKAMMFVKLYFCTSDIYLISLVSLDPSGFHLRTEKMPSIEQVPIYDVYCIGRRQYQRFLNNLLWDILVVQLVASMSGVVLGQVIMVVGSNLVRGKIFTVSIGSADSLYISVFIYRMNLHQVLIL